MLPHPVKVIFVETVSAALILLYVVWVIGYDLPWSYTFWKLNPPDQGQAKRAKTVLEE